MTLSPERVEQKAADAVRDAGNAVAVTLDRRVVEMLLQMYREQRAEVERLKSEMASERAERLS